MYVPVAANVRVDYMVKPHVYGDIADSRGSLTHNAVINRFWLTKAGETLKLVH